MDGSRLLRFILLTLPLTNSVTLPVGFPLKIYELLGFVALATALTGRGLDLGGRRKIPALWGLFFFVSLPASAWGLFAMQDLDLSMFEWAHGRYHPLVNTAFHYVYLAFDIGLLCLTVDALVRRDLTPREFCRWWTYGALLAVAYAVALNLVVAAGLSPLLLLRWDGIQVMEVAGVSVVRTGPFEEGNFFGLYLLISLTINLWAMRRCPDRLFRLAVVPLVLGAVITASPAALLGSVVMLLLASVGGRVSPLVRGGTVTAGVVFLGVLAATGLLRTIVLDKFSLILYGGVTDVRNVSLIQRLNESHHAWLMFLDHPQGVGMGNFGYFFGQYPDLYPWLKSAFTTIKHIPNNVYLEVLSEHGVVGAVVFALAFYRKGAQLLRGREFLVLAGLVMMAVYFVAFPTFRLSMIWVFWGFVVFLGAPDDRRPAAA